MIASASARTSASVLPTARDLDDRPAPHDRRDVGVVAHLVELVGHDDDRAPPPAREPAQHRVERVRLARREDGGGLVEDERPSRRDRARARSRAAAGRRRRATPRARRAESPPRAPARSPRPSRAPLPMSSRPSGDRTGSAPSTMFSSAVNASTSAKCCWTIATPRRIASAGVCGSRRSSVHPHLPFVGLEEPGRDPQERALAGAVLPDDGVDTPALERERRRANGVDRAETLVNAVELERRRAPVCDLPGSSARGADRSAPGIARSPLDLARLGARDVRHAFLLRHVESGLRRAARELAVLAPLALFALACADTSAPPLAPPTVSAPLASSLPPPKSLDPSDGRSRRLGRRRADRVAAGSHPGGGERAGPRREGQGARCRASPGRDARRSSASHLG